MPGPTCPLCRDTGYVGRNPAGDWCACDARPFAPGPPAAPKVLTAAEEAFCVRVRGGRAVLGDLAAPVATYHDVYEASQ